MYFIYFEKPLKGGEEYSFREITFYKKEHK